MKRIRVMIMICILSSFCLLGCQSDQSIKISSNDESIAFRVEQQSDSKIPIKQTKTGLIFETDNGVVTGEIISDAVADRLNGEHYLDESFLSLFIQDKVGFGYVDMNDGKPCYVHVIRLSEGQNLKLSTKSSNDAMYMVESEMKFVAEGGSVNDNER